MPQAFKLHSGCYRWHKDYTGFKWRVALKLSFSNSFSSDTSYSSRTSVERLDAFLPFLGKINPGLPKKQMIRPLQKPLGMTNLRPVYKIASPIFYRTKGWKKGTVRKPNSIVSIGTKGLNTLTWYDLVCRNIFSMPNLRTPSQVITYPFCIRSVADLLPKPLLILAVEANGVTGSDSVLKNNTKPNKTAQFLEIVLRDCAYTWSFSILSPRSMDPCSFRLPGMASLCTSQ